MKNFIVILLTILAMAPFVDAAHYGSHKFNSRESRAERSAKSQRKIFSGAAKERAGSNFLAKLVNPSPQLSPRSRTPQHSSLDREEVTARIKFNASNAHRGLFQNSGNSRNLFSSLRMPQRSPLRKLGSTLAVRTTAYTHSESDHLVYGRQTAIGTILRSSNRYTSAASDWSRFPLGTTFKIVGEPTTYVIDDYGSALVGTNTIDIYRPSRSAMNRWGTRNVAIKILKIGSFEKSREHLAQVTGYWHCRVMYRALS